jgi:DNA-directed RNA polymerase subunit K/omega
LKKNEIIGEGRQDKSLEELTLSQTQGKYELVQLATRWAQEIKTRENRPETPQEILQLALLEILRGDISLEQVEKLPPLTIISMDAKAPEAKSSNAKDVAAVARELGIKEEKGSKGAKEKSEKKK